MVCLDTPDYTHNYIAYFPEGKFYKTSPRNHLKSIFVDDGAGVVLDYFQSSKLDFGSTRAEVKVYYDVFYVCASYWDDEYVYSGTSCYVNDKYKDFFDSSVVESGYKGTRNRQDRVPWGSPKSIKVDNVVYVRDWQEPIGVFTLKHGTLLNITPIADRTVLYNPLDNINFNLDDPNLQYSTVNLRYSGVEPRYDLENVYILSPDPAKTYFPDYSPNLEQVAAWVLNKDIKDVIGTDFVKNSSF